MAYPFLIGSACVSHFDSLQDINEQIHTAECLKFISNKSYSGHIAPQSGGATFIPPFSSSSVAFYFSQGVLRYAT